MSFGEQFYLTTRNPWRRFTRNLRLLAYIGFLLWTWFTVGGRVRNACKKAAGDGKPFEVDALAGGELLGKHQD
ncbi:MAG: hypothetical protein QNJ73_03255 [Gammaproteobacteria bacterium]|nr:hypothetical protein [Gammaproteobacteria bacterium]